MGCRRLAAMRGLWSSRDEMSKGGLSLCCLLVVGICIYLDRGIISVSIYAEMENMRDVDYISCRIPRKF